jgi:hypothetical protein
MQRPLATVIVAGMLIGPILLRVAVPRFCQARPPRARGYASRPPQPILATPGVAAGEAQRFMDGQDLPGEGWTLFHSRPLNE